MESLCFKHGRWQVSDDPTFDEWIKSKGYDIEDNDGIFEYLFSIFFGTETSYGRKMKNFRRQYCKEMGFNVAYGYTA